MPLVVKDRVKETTTTTGTGTLTLAGAVTGFQAFSVIGDGNTTYYTITDGTNFEVGVGTYTLSGTTLSRDTILESSNSGSAVNFSAGSKEVFVTYPAERAVYTDAAGTAITPATASTLGVVSGGTGQTSYTNGQLLIGNTTGNTLTKATLTAGTGISVTDGTGSITIAATNNGTVTSVSGTGTVQGLTLSGTVTSSGSLTLGGSLSAVSLTTQVTGDLPFANLAQGSALSVLGVTGNATADVASIAAGTDHQVLRRSGTTVAFGSVNLAQSAAVTGTLPVGNGGTGASTLTANNVILGNGTSAVQFVAPGTTGNVLTSNGSTWTSAAAAGGAAGGIGAQVFTSSGTFTIPSGVAKLKVTVIGGGGNGGAKTAIAAASAAGGGAGVAVKYLTGLTGGNTLTVTVGTAANTSSVASGTQTISTISATGGASVGSNVVTPGGAGGAGSGGDINITGGAGSVGNADTGAATGSAGGGSSGMAGGRFGLSGSGGGVGFIGGTGGNQTAGSLNAVGTPGTGFGNGGSGANTTNAARAGGAGSAGVVIFEF